MTDFEHGYLVAVTNLCMLGWWSQAAELLPELGLQYDWNKLPDVDKQYMGELIARHSTVSKAFLNKGDT